jgi:hypothetical protein
VAKWMRRYRQRLVNGVARSSWASERLLDDAVPRMSYLIVDDDDTVVADRIVLALC